MAVPAMRQGTRIARKYSSVRAPLSSLYHRWYASASDKPAVDPDLRTKHGQQRPWLSESGERLKLAPQDTNKYWIQRLKALAMEPATNEAALRAKARELQLALDEFNSRTKV